MFLFVVSICLGIQFYFVAFAFLHHPKILHPTHYIEDVYHAVALSELARIADTKQRRVLHCDFYAEAGLQIGNDLGHSCRLEHQPPVFPRCRICIYSAFVHVPFTHRELLVGV